MNVENQTLTVVEEGGVGENCDNNPLIENHAIVQRNTASFETGATTYLCCIANETTTNNLCSKPKIHDDDEEEEELREIDDAANKFQHSTTGLTEDEGMASSTTSNEINSENDNSHDDYDDPDGTVCECWSMFCDSIRGFLCNTVVSLSVLAAKNPWTCMVIVFTLSIALMAIGIKTNFTLNVDTTELFTPRGSRVLKHKLWINNDLKNSDSNGAVSLIVHADGDNVLQLDGVQRLFSVMDTIQNIDDYDNICQAGTYQYNGKKACYTSSVTRFWGFNTTTFNEKVQTNQDIFDTVSETTYPDGVPVQHGSIILGTKKSESDDEDENGKFIWADAIYVVILFPLAKIPLEQVTIFERTVSDTLLDIRTQWENEIDNNIKLEFFTRTSYEDEFNRAIENDLPLIPMVFATMVAFTCIAFFKKDQIRSRSLLGLGGVVTVLLSIVSGYGLLFIFGVPLTPMTNILPFILFGIGLDDTFIIACEYNRHGHLTDPIERIRESMNQCALSISTTTTTTCFAFILGLISTVPTIYWLCLYAFPMIMIDFMYQITFFVALIVIDERRIQSKRRDCCLCLQRNDEDSSTIVEEKNFYVVDQLMSWYAKLILRPWIRVLVIIMFTLYFAVSIYSTTLMEQEFQFTDLVPKDSYIKSFTDSLEKHYSRGIMTDIYFRFVDQSDPEIQNQMIDYVDQLAAVPSLGAESTFCWVRDFRRYQTLYPPSIMQNLTFNEQIDYMLEDPTIREVYGNHIIRNETTGDIIASRCNMFFTNVQLSNVQSQINALNEQRRVSASHPMNQNRDDDNWATFTYDDMYFLWEFYNSAIIELITTTISAIVAVAIVSFVLVPHRTAVWLILPLICILYVDLIGTMQFIGVKINVISYIAFVVAIGLMVDFIMHIILRYYESEGRTREQKVTEALKTMGTSIFLGGLSTFLSTIPLLFSTSAILGTIFSTFFAMVTLSLTHGLILLPVILSLIGPIDDDNNAALQEDEDTITRVKF